MIDTQGSKFRVDFQLAEDFPKLVVAHGLEYRETPRWARKTSGVTGLPAVEVFERKSSVGLWSMRSEAEETNGEKYFINLSFRRRSRELAERVQAILVEAGATLDESLD